MVSSFVLDASVAVRWFLDDERSTEADAVLARIAGDGVLVPAIWPYETTNALLAAQRRNRISRGDVATALEFMQNLPVSIEPASALHAERAWNVALARSLTVYDAAYLDLASRHILPLATFDDALRRAARKSGVSLLRI